MKVIILFALLATVCLANKAFQYTIDTVNATETVNMGEGFRIELKSNPSTGFRWELLTIPENVDSLSNDKYGEFVGSNNNLMGAGGKQAYSFTATKAGFQKLKFVYMRPWTNEGSSNLEVSINIFP